MLSDEQIQEIRDGCRTDWRFNLNEFARKIESAARAEALNDAADVCGMEICECCWGGDALAAASHLSDKIIELKDKVK